jgi:putative colanic acid biosynthesis acetyltransferase WcaF
MNSPRFQAISVMLGASQPDLKLSNRRIADSLAEHRITCKSRVFRALWHVVWLLLFRPSPVPLHAWRRFLLRCFGARIGKGAHAYPSVKVWAPWNLTMGEHSGMGHYVDCYCVDRIELGAFAAVSQYSFLCTATHDYEDPGFGLRSARICIGARAWVAADVFVGPGVSLGQGAVALARSVVLKDVPAWTVVAGSPARFVKPRPRHTTDPLGPV